MFDFRDGVSETQFNEVLNTELGQSKRLGNLASKVYFDYHHTKFFQKESPNNVPPGTVVDRQICHPLNNDFYICSHAGMIGKTRPTQYHVLSGDIGFSADEMQELVHSLSYRYRRSTTAISVVYMLNLLCIYCH
ncbi:hypothetical protein MKW94_016647 [Papaver nudicaule]|uniref:Piwi domain-containing protein n=1 Tax=Papaver nudicaule TaxID=74823 RepID=A0AA41VFD6_PAPNU|nr:hypothetical protein [Papaver nudicaule]